MDVIPTIRTANTRISSRDYQDYLKSSAWKRTRNAALKRAHYTCSACPSKRDLQVHHLTYERLGHERDADLQVLCKACHGGEHFNQLQDELGIYTRLASEALRTGADSPSEIREVMRELCLKHRVKYEPWKVDSAINRVTVNRLPLVGAPAKALRYQPAPCGEDATPQEAAGLLKRIRDTLGDMGLIKTMPPLEQSEAEYEAQREKLRLQAKALGVFVKPAERRVPLEQRIEAIFAGKL